MIQDAGLHQKLNPGLPWKTRYSTRRPFSPGNL